MNDFTPKITRCAGTCGRMTRNTRFLKKDYPDTVVRERDGKCRWCLNHANEPGNLPPVKAVPVSGLVLCAGICGRITRHSRILISDAPQSVTRVRDGKCQWCIDHEDDPSAVFPPKPGPKPAKPRVHRDAGIEQAVAAYNHFAADRRARLARRARMQTAAAHTLNMSRRGIFA
ncbi:hypothetical protein SEA_BRUHMOMENT_68 [Arthrobacter phage BruhMoment]|nr:hypothetical protein SEA_BRUHMOMENT_68 [Arthrobacter phage BruhMoment]